MVGQLLMVGQLRNGNGRAAPNGWQLLMVGQLMVGPNGF